MFDSETLSGTLYVPKGTKADYQSAEGWKDFKNIEEIITNNIITFADAEVKRICVENWDANGDGELSELEAAAVTDLGEVFSTNNTIKTFDELSFFTGLTSIGSRAFQNCTGLTSITIPNSVTSIGSYALYGCTGLSSIAIPNSVTSIGDYAFSGCSGLTSINISKNVTSIGRLAFYDCSGLTSIVVESGNTKYDSRDNCNAIIQTVNNTLIAGCQNTVVPNGVTSIGDYAFSYCYGLTSIVIPSSVTSIGGWTFEGCSGITSITISKSVESIGYEAFRGCDNLTTVTCECDTPPTIFDATFEISTLSGTLYVPKGTKAKYQIAEGWSGFKKIEEFDIKIAFVDAEVKRICIENWDTNGDGQLSGTEAEAVTDLGVVFSTNSTIKSFDELTYFTGLTSIRENAFSLCSGLTAITIPNSVTSIGRGAFSGCSGLTSLTIPNSVIGIGEAAFLNCKNLISITLPSSLTNIGNSLLENCSGLTSIIIPNSVTSIGHDAFNGCSGLTSITIPNSVISIGEGAFEWCGGLTSIIISNSVTSLGDYAFNGCTGLTSITIPNSVTSIGRGVFSRCSGLTSITIPNSITSIEENAFQNCSNLTSVNISDLGAWCNISFGGSNSNPLSFAHHLFLNGEEIKDLVIPNNVNDIGNYAFYGCGSLNSIAIPQSVTSIGEYTFYGCSSLTSIVVDSGNQYYDSRNDCNAIVETATNTLIIGCQNTKIPNSVTGIGDRAFYGCGGLTSITIPDGVTSIGNDAFYNCSGLTSVTVMSKTPITINYGTFTNRFNAILYVPYGCKAKYQAATYWKDFKEIVEKYEHATGVSLSKTEVTLNEGESVMLTATVSPDDAETTLIWTSSDENVATVNQDGEVTAVAPGMATITVTTDNGLSATCTVTVTMVPTDVVWEDTEHHVVYGFNTGGTKAKVVQVGEAATGDVVIRDIITYMGKEFTVMEVSSDACAEAYNVTSVTVPASVTTIGQRAFANDGLLALVWQSNVDVPADVLPEEAKRSKSFLLYVNSISQAPYGMANIVVKPGNGYEMQGTLMLEEDEDFHCPVAFKAETVSYTHEYQMATGFGSSEGWETLALPFDVETIRHADGRVLVSFASYRADSDNRPFWLYAMSADGFVKTGSIKANTPYIICMPNNEAYLPEYNITGEVTFMAHNVMVQPSTDVQTVTAGNRTFVPTFRKIRSSSSVATLNSVNRLHSNTGGEAPGSRFISNLRLASPFEAVFEGSASGVRSFAIDFAPGETNGIDDIPATRPGEQRIYNLKGQRVSKMQRGHLYIVGGRKVVSN